MSTHIVLLGAGNANLQIVRWWGQTPIPGARLTLVTDSELMPYSGMIPGLISGTYRSEALTVDVVRLCEAAGVQLRLTRAEGLDPDAQRILTQDGEPVSYDQLAINIGSRPLLPCRLPEGRELQLKPLHTLEARATAMGERMKASPRIAVIGGGAAGFEMSLALERRWREHGAQVALLSSGERVGGASPAVSAYARRVLNARGITLRLGARVTGANDASLELEDGGTVPYDYGVWATPAAALPVNADLGLPLDAERGFIRVQPTLQTVEHANIYAAGDCAAFDAYPDLPRAGVFSVREGPVLWRNLQAAVSGEPATPYEPQRHYLFLLNTSDGRAIMSYGRYAAMGAWAFRWKDFIDRRWMRQFH